MNNITKILIGALVGGGIGYLLGDAYCQVNIVNSPSMILYAPLDNKKELKVMPNQKVVIKDYTHYFSPEVKESLDKLAAKYNNGEIDPLEEALATDIKGMDSDYMIEDELVQKEEKDPSIITMEEYADSNGFEKLTFNYYFDDVLTDQHDNPITKPEQILGDEALVSFGVGSYDHDVVYVRNKAKKADYEIVRLETSYSELLDVEPVKPTRRQALSKMEKEEYGEKDNP